MRKKTRRILPQEADGRVSRQLSDMGVDVETFRNLVGDWYGPPVPIAGVPAYIYRGEFMPMLAGGTGFTSLSDLIAEATSGKKQELNFLQNGTANVLGRGSSLWGVGTVPAAGAAPSGLADAALTRSTTGALTQQNPSGTDTLHCTTQFAFGSAGPHSLGLYDRLNHFRPALNSTSGQNVTGTQTRYNTATTAPGNFLFVEVATVLAGTAHNWTATYTDQDGTSNQVVPSTAGVSAAAVNTMDHAQWFLPLASGDTGPRALTQITLSATLASGAVNWVLGHMMMFIPILAAYVPSIYDGINSAFSLHEVKTDACMAHLVIPSVTTATTFSGTHEFVAG